MYSISQRCNYCGKESKSLWRFFQSDCGAVSQPDPEHPEGEMCGVCVRLITTRIMAVVDLGHPLDGAPEDNVPMAKLATSN